MSQFTETLDTDGQESSELRIPRGKTAQWGVDANELVNGEVQLLVTENNRGTWEKRGIVVTGANGGRYSNDTQSDAYAKFRLIEKGGVLDGKADVTAATEPSVVVVLRDPATSKVLIEYGDEAIYFHVPPSFDIVDAAQINADNATVSGTADVSTLVVHVIDASQLPTYENTSEAILDGAAEGSLYATSAGAVQRVTGPS